MQTTQSPKGVIKVKLLRAGRVIRSYKVKSETFTIGTDKGSTIRAAGDPEVKPLHATIYIDDERELTLVPEPGATVLINGEPIDFAIPKPDDLIKIGKLTVQVELAETLDSIPPTDVKTSKPPRPSVPIRSVPPPRVPKAPPPSISSVAPNLFFAERTKRVSSLVLSK